MSRPLILCVAALVASPFALASDTKIELSRNSVVPVTFRDEIGTVNSRRGDKFFAVVEGDRDLPYGTKFEGRVLDVRHRHDDRPASIDLEFNRLILPDGKSFDIRAVPITFDKDHVVRNSDGHYVASKDVVKRENYVLGGAVGGFLLGEIIKKPFEGAFLGTLIGIAASENAPAQSGEVCIKRGAKMGVLFEKDLVIETNSHYGGYDRDSRVRPQDPRDPRDDRDSRDSRDTRDPRDTRDSRDRGGDVPKIVIHDRELRFASDTQPFYQDDEIMVPLERAASQCDVTIEKLNNNVILLSSDDSMLRVEPDSQNYRLNGKRGNFRKSVVVRDGVVYVPVEALAMMKVGTVTVNGTNVDDRS